MNRILLSILSGCVVCIACVSALGGTLIYSEDFESGTAVGWSRGNVIADGIDGKSYHNSGSNGNWGVLLNPIPDEPIIETGRIEFDIQITGSCRLFVSGNGTYADRDRGFTHIHFNTDGTIDSSAPVWQLGEPFRFAIDWLADSAPMYVNDVYVGDGSQNFGDFTEFYFRFNDEPSAITIDNVVVEAYTLAPERPKLTLYIEEDGDAYLKNATDADIEFMAYNIMSASGSLDRNGWRSIHDVRNGDLALQIELLTVLGPDAFQFMEEANSPGSLGERLEILVPPVSIAPGAMWYIGNSAPGASAEDISFFFTDPNVDEWEAIEGNVVIVPEPATISLLALGGLTMLRQRKRRACK